MERNEAQNKINDLVNTLNEHNYNYYVLDNPKITDAEYDRLLKELNELEQAFPEFISEASPTQRVGGTPVKGFNTVEHVVPLLSLSNAFNEQDLMDFDRRVKKWFEWTGSRIRS